LLRNCCCPCINSKAFAGEILYKKVSAVLPLLPVVVLVVPLTRLLLLWCRCRGCCAGSCDKV
jgi:hypothetical protein